VLGEGRARKLAEIVGELETLKDVRDLTAWFVPA
jgi:hypothetical protein